MFGLSPLIMYAIMAIAIFGAGATSGWKIESWRWGSSELAAQQKADDALIKETKRANDAAAELEKERANADASTRVVTQYVDKIVSRPVYLQSCFDDDGLRAVNAAIQGKADAATGLDSPVPAADAAGKRSGGNGPTKVR